LDELASFRTVCQDATRAYNPRVVTVEVLTIGNEILLGLVQDTNSNYLCRVVRGMGGRVRRITVVRDEADQIAAELGASLDRRTDLIVSCGGLGPTDDDVTLNGVAIATGRSIVLNQSAKDFVERKYRHLAEAGYVATAEMTESRLKMARLPEGSDMIENPVGAAPAVSVKSGNSRIVCLPGVPTELKAIVEGPLQSLLGEVFGLGSYRELEILVESGDESQLAPSLRQVASAHPDVYIKSRASAFGPEVKFRIMFSATARSAEVAESQLRDASNDLIRAFGEAGIRVIPPRSHG
jgi:molybdenum cofactor synthesis domain-containing protein